MNMAGTESGYATEDTSDSNSTKAEGNQRPQTDPGVAVSTNKPNSTSLKNLRKPTPLQKKIEKHRERVKSSESNGVVEKQPKKTTTIIPISQLSVPAKKTTSTSSVSSSDEKLVAIDSDSDDEIGLLSGNTSSKVKQELKRQLKKDGFRLDEVTDDEDLDLIPPHHMENRCVCCQVHSSCSVQ